MQNTICLGSKYNVFFGYCGLKSDICIYYLKGKYKSVEDHFKNANIIGSNDLFIASIVLAHNGILVTHNTDEFKRVSGLKIDDWVEETK
jgi:predicted nucleic acid-binding protein